MTRIAVNLDIEPSRRHLAARARGTWRRLPVAPGGGAGGCAHRSSVSRRVTE